MLHLPITFDNRANFRSEVLTFEVVDFLGSYHAILVRPCYAKFMAIPNYTYLKLKMPGPNSVITVSSAFLHAFTCDREHYELATAVVNLSELPRLGESLIPVVPDCNKPTSSMAFRPLEETKAVGIDPTDPAKMVRIGTKLSANRKASSPTSYVQITMSSRGSLLTCRAYRGRSPSMHYASS